MQRLSRNGNQCINIAGGGVMRNRGCPWPSQCQSAGYGSKYEKINGVLSARNRKYGVAEINLLFSVCESWRENVTEEMKSINAAKSAWQLEVWRLAQWLIAHRWRGGEKRVCGFSRNEAMTSGNAM